MKKIAFVVAAAAAFGAFAGNAIAAPADKVAVAADATLGFECDGTDPGIPNWTIPCTDTDANSVIDGNRAVLIPGFLYKGSTTADLIFQFATECTLFNYVKRTSEDVSWSTSDAGVVVWIELDDDPLALGSSDVAGLYEMDETGESPVTVKVSPKDASADPNGEVTFCQRIVGLKLTETSAIDGTLQAELAIASMSANAFNWVAQDPSTIFGTNGYYIRVMARIELASFNDGISGAGFRQRSLIVEPVHLANGTEF